MKKVTVVKLQNEKAVQEFCPEFKIGAELELPVKGFCVFYSNYYQMEREDGSIIHPTGGFPIGDVCDDNNRKYMAWLDKTGISIYLEIHKN